MSEAIRFLLLGNDECLRDSGLRGGNVLGVKRWRDCRLDGRCTRVAEVSVDPLHGAQG